MKATIESAGKVSSRVRLGNHELLFDQPASVRNGEDRGPSPLDVLVASFGACAHYFGTAYLSARGVDASTLAVEVEAEKQPISAGRIGRLALKVRVPPGLDEPHLIGLIRAIKACPAYGTLVHPPKIELTVEVSTPDEDRLRAAT
jgi:putative redox protein